MKQFVLIDLYNIFFRALYSVNASDDIEMQKGLMLHTMIMMCKTVCDMFHPDHLVVCSDGNGTWRKSIYPQYKLNRIERLQDRSPQEVLRDEALKDTLENDFIPFLKERTNISFLDAPQAEADDLIARFIFLHPNDNCIIVSTDNDYVQLLSDNVIIYNTMDERLITKDCMLDARKKTPLKFGIKSGKVSVSKTDYIVKKGEPLVPMKDWIEYALFNKIVRGDSSDNIASAYPRIREKSTSKSVGVLDAFQDRFNKGFNWQSFMNSTWENPLGERKIVRECYEFNKTLVDLNAIPDRYKEQFDEAICVRLNNKEHVKNVGFYLAKYLNKWHLERLLSMVESFSKYFSQDYPKEEVDEIPDFHP